MKRCIRLCRGERPAAGQTLIALDDVHQEYGAGTWASYRSMVT